MPELDDPNGVKSGEQKKMPKVPKQNEACNHSKEGVKCGVHGMKECPDID